MMLNELFKKVLTSDTGLYPYQFLLHNQLSENKDVIINKSRQVGISFFIAGYCYLRALAGEVVMIINPSLRQTKHLMGFILQFHDAMKPFLKDDDILEATRTSLTLKHGGAIYSIPNSPATARGIRAHVVVFDEFGHFLYGTDKEIWEAVLPSISRGGQVVLISTPFGENNLYYDIWNNSGGKYDNFERVKIHWSECPHINIDRIKANLDQLSYLQEYENAFLGDIGSYFPYELLKSCIDNDITHWEGSELFIGIDIGRRSDFTAITLLERLGSNYQIIYWDILRHTPFKDQKKRILELINSYKPLKVAIDETGIGMQLAEELKEEYHHLISPVTFTNENKGDMMVTLRRLFEMKQIKIPDNPAIINALHMIQRTQAGSSVKYESEKKTDEYGHADSAWSLALAAYCDKLSQEFAVVEVGF